MGPEVVSSDVIIIALGSAYIPYYYAILYYTLLLGGCYGL